MSEAGEEAPSPARLRGGGSGRGLLRLLWKTPPRPSPASQERERLLRAALALLLLAAAGCHPWENRDDRPALSVAARLVPRFGETLAASSSAPARGGLRTLAGKSYPALTVTGAETRVTWPVRLPAASRLHFGYTVTAPPGSRATVRVSVEIRREDGSRVRIYRARRPAAELSGRVEEAEVPLRHAAGAGEIVFSAAAEGLGEKGENGFAVHWLDPLVLARHERPRRNLIVICVDTLRADRLASFGGKQSALPRMDERLRSAAVFSRAYSNASWTLPSISTLLTGLYPGQHNAGRRSDRPDREGGSAATDWSPKTLPGGIELVIDGRAYQFQMLHPAVPALQDVLGGAGYTAAALHNNGYLNPPTGVFKGVDLLDQYGAPDAATGTGEALRWVRGHRDRDLFLFLHYLDPHQWYLKIPDEILARRPEELSAGDRQRVLAAYDELCRRTDRELDRLFAGLERLGVLRDSYVVFLADHGERFFEGTLAGGHGDSLDESLLRVPLAIWGPGIEPRRITTRVSLVDVAPTVLELLGAPAPGGLSGRSLVPLLRGRQEKDRTLIAESVLRSDDQTALFEGRWKYVLRRDPDRGALYDLARDPGEAEDVLARQPDAGARMRAALDRYLAETEERFRRLRYGGTSLDRETWESLRALGYIGGK